MTPTARSVLARRPGRALAFLVQIARAFRLAVLVPAHVFTAPLVSVVFWQRRTRAAGNRRAPTRSPFAPAGLPAAPMGVASSRGGSAPPLDEPGTALAVRPSVEWVAVGPDFRPPQYAAMFARLQHPPGSKVFDLRTATVIEMELFEQLGHAWRAPTGTVPRLAILVRYENWVALRHVAACKLRPTLTGAGVELELFYGQQLGSLAAWFTEGRVYHDHLPEVLEWLRTQWRRSTTWPLVLSTTEMLIHATAAVDAAPDMLIQLSAIALSFDGPDAVVLGAQHASAALAWVGTAPSAARCRALRAVAIARIHQGNPGEALALLDTAYKQAAAIRDRVEQARALAEIGFQALRGGDFAYAETRFRRAIVLVSATDAPYLRAALHHSLADALHQQGKNPSEAERHAALALSLRWNQESRLAQDDRTLLSRIRAGLPSPASE